MSPRPPFRSGVALWIAAPFLLWLSLHRPAVPSEGRAERLAGDLPGFTFEGAERMTERYYDLLGTRDAAWLRFRPEGGSARVWLVALFHEENWKSVHPPHLCIEGSDMTILEDDALTFAADGREVSAGRILAQSERSGRRHLSLFVFGGRDFVTGSFASFFLHHAPLALFRLSTSGFLLRADTWVAGGDVAAAEERCTAFLRAMLPRARELLR